jgi:transmembrane protein 231
MVTEAMGYVDVVNPVPGSSLFTDGFLNLYQSGYMTDKKDFLFNSPVFDMNSLFSSNINGIYWPQLITDYLNRDVRVSYDYTPVWNYKGFDRNKFNIAMKVRVPTWKIEYIPNLMEVLKHGWIQFLATFVFTGGILFYIWDFLISNQIVPTIAYSDLRECKNKY